MKRTSIPGPLDYHALANANRPRTREGIAAAVRELHRQGLKSRDIAQALRPPLEDVLAIVVEARHG